LPTTILVARKPCRHKAGVGWSDTFATKGRPGLRVGRGLIAGALDAPADDCGEEYHLGSFCCQRRSIRD
jgi:hypothetical protein